MSIHPEQRELAQALFEGALERKPEERASYLEQACPSDPQLREYILRMVASSEADPSFLETPVLAQILSSPLLEKGDLVGGRFRIIRLVGRGGMSEVYEAEDIEVGKERVALKMVRRDLMDLDETAARLRREIEFVHRIGHPNVCKIYDLVVDRRPEGDLLFLTMDFLEGETLSDRLERTGPLPQEAAFAIAAQIAAGLDAAHEEGIIHSDLKSSNIMLVPRKDGTTRAVITDFGIACSLDEEDGRGPGTLDYMPPERLRQPGNSPSADIYSLGVILYEMVVGRRPFPSRTPLEQRRKRPPAPRTVRRGVGWRWNRAIERCLDPSPEKRFARAADLVDALRTPRWPVPVAACLIPLLLVALIRPDLVLRFYDLIFVKGPVQVVAILPFDRAGSAPEEGLIDHLAEQIQKNRIIRGKWLVYTPAEVRRMGVTTPTQARAVLGASRVLAGTVTREPDSVTVAGRLLDTRTSQPAGSFQKTCPLDNAVCLQDGMLQAAAAALLPQGLSFTAPPLISAEALPYYLQGLFYLRRDSLSYELAISFLQKALEKDALSAQPRIALADAYMLQFRDKGDKAMIEAARKILDEVLATHPGLPELHASLGNLHAAEGQYEAATRELLVAVQADPSNHIFHRQLGHIYGSSKQDADAVTEFKKTIELQPRYWAGYLAFAVFHHTRGRFREAADLLERLIQWAPDHAQGLAALGGVYVDMGRNADAERVSRRSCDLKPARTCYLNLGLALHRQQRARDAITAYDKALAFGSPGVMEGVLLLLNRADAHADLGERDQAQEFFRRAVARAEESLKINLRNSGLRAILAYCLAQTGDRKRAEFELEQAFQDSPHDKNVRKYGVLTYESTGQRDKALETLRGATEEVLEELQLAWGTTQLRQDPRFPEVAQEVRSR